MTRRPKKRRFGHRFIMGWEQGANRQWIPQKGPSVPVLRPPHSIVLELTVEDVLRAHQRKGEGDTRHCAVACLIRRQTDRFLPYAVNGVIEFQDSRAFVGIGKLGNYPKQALRFEHTYSWLTQIFDQKGYKKLIERINAKGGTINLTLAPFRLRANDSSDGKKKSPKDNSRSKIGSIGPMRRSMRLDDRSIGEVKSAELPFDQS